MRDDTCGYEVLSPPIEAETPDWRRWRALDDGRYRCQRPAWNATGRCVWHADSEDKSLPALRQYRADDPERLDGATFVELDFSDTDLFVGCSLARAQFRDVTLDEADFSTANLWDATFEGSTQVVDAHFENAVLDDVSTTDEIEFRGSTFRDSQLTGAVTPNCSFRGAEFVDTGLENATLSGCDLRRATFENVDLQGAELDDAILEDAKLIRADLRETDFEGARLYQVLLSDVQVSGQTVFGDRCRYETDPDVVIDVRGDGDEVDRFHAGAWVYRRLESLCEENALSDRARHYHIRKREMERRHAEATGETLEAWVSRLSCWMMCYGESLRRILITSAGVIVLSTIGFAFAGITEDGTLYGLLVDGKNTNNNPLVVLGQSAYFSVISFTTVGFGDVEPATGWAKFIASFESILGALLVALFVFVLGRRVAR